MKTSQFKLLLIIALVIIVVGVAVNRNRRGAWQAAAENTGDKLVGEFDPNNVAKVILKTAAGETTTLLNQDGSWVVAERYNYPAKFEGLRDLLTDLQELSAAQILEVGESQFGRLELADPGKDKCGAQITLVDDKGKKLAEVIFGKEHMKKSSAPANPMMGMGGGNGWPDGRYIRLPASGTVALVSKTFSNIGDKAEQWLDKEFFKISDIKEVSLSEGGKTLWNLSRESKTGDLKLAGDIPKDKEIDSSKLSSIKSAFSYASFSDVADPALKAPDTGMDKPKTFVAKTFDDFVYTINIGKKNDGGKFYMTVKTDFVGSPERPPVKDEKAEDKEKKDKEYAAKFAENQKTAADINARTGKWIYLVPSYSVENITKKREDFLKDKPKPKEDDKAKNPPSPPPAK